MVLDQPSICVIDWIDINEDEKFEETSISPFKLGNSEESFYKEIYSLNENLAKFSFSIDEILGESILTVKIDIEEMSIEQLKALQEYHNKVTKK